MNPAPEQLSEAPQWRDAKDLSMRQNVLWLTVGLSFLFTLIGWRLVQIQLVDHERYTELAVANHLRKLELPARRGDILDCSGETLARTQLVHDVRIDCKGLPEPAKTLRRIAGILELPAKELIAAYNPANRYWLVKRCVGESEVAALRNLHLPQNLVFEEKFVRSYPNGAHASHVVGWLAPDAVGAAGVEREMELFLRGISGERWIERDRRGREIPAYRRKDQPPSDGFSVMLTLNLEIQHIVENQLDALQAQYQPAGACVIVTRPKTGEILALANRPTFDPNCRDERMTANQRNIALVDRYEPGSTFKIVTVAGAVDAGAVTLNMPFFCENGVFQHAGYVLHDHEPYSTLTTQQILQVSSNIGTAKIALLLGEDKLYALASAFGFGRPTGLFGGQAESAGVLRPVSKWSKLSITRVPIGQEVAATPLQMAMAMGVIANGGRLMAPRLVRQISNADGQPVKVFNPQVVRQVIRPESAREVSRALTTVVEAGGTAVEAQVPGFTVAGKTGTAQKFIDGEWSKTKYLASFIGYFPEENPQVLIATFVDEPKTRPNRYYGGQVAAPAFREMAQRIAQVLNLTPDAPRAVPRATPVMAQQTQEAAL